MPETYSPTVQLLAMLDRLASEPVALERVWLAREIERHAAELLRSEVASAHDQGASWTDVGDVLGTTRQAAHARFGSR